MGMRDVEAFEMRLQEDCIFLETQRENLGLQSGIQLVSGSDSLTTAIWCSKDREVGGFADLIAMKNMYPRDFSYIFQPEYLLKKNLDGKEYRESSLLVYLSTRASCRRHQLS